MKKLNKFFAVLVALAMMAMLCVTAAFAEGEAPTATPETAKLVKYLEVPEGTAVPTVVNVFTFTPNEEASSNVTADELVTANPGTQTVTVNAQSPATAAEDANSVYQADPLKALGTFTHPGVYAYTVTETSSTITDGTDAQEIVPGGETYIVRYVVKNVGGVPTVTDITVQDEQGNKEDPKTTDPTTNDDTTTTDVEYDGFTFKNTYQKTEGDGTLANAPLKVTKTVTGENAPTDTSFPFTMTLTKALGADDTAPTAQVYDAQGNAKGNPIAVTYGTPFTFNLMNGETLAFVTLPAGTRYAASETMANADAYSAYAPSVIVNTDEYTASADLGQTLAAQADGTYLVEENDKDLVAYTNDYDKDIDTPTGILISNLPYIVLALVAIGGLVAYVVVRRRNADEA